MTINRRSAVLIIALVVGATAVPIVSWWQSSTAQTVDRVERDHGIDLPESARDVQAMGDVIRLVDHGLSSVFVIDSVDLDKLVDQLDQVADVSHGTFIPGNAQYQPRTFPWPPGSAADQSFGKASPAGGDFMHVEIFRVDDASVGVWIYTDWN